MRRDRIDNVRPYLPTSLSACPPGARLPAYRSIYLSDLLFVGLAYWLAGLETARLFPSRAAFTLQLGSIYTAAQTVLRDRLQRYRGIVDCLRQTIQAGGARGIYAGLGTSTLGILPYAGTDLAVYSWLKDRYAARHPDSVPVVPVLLGCGALSSTAGQLLAYPVQLVRTKVQAQGLPGMRHHGGPLQCARTTLAEEGVAGLYRGIGPNFLKSLPAISVSYAVFETVKTQLARPADGTAPAVP